MTGRNKWEYGCAVLLAALVVSCLLEAYYYNSVLMPDVLKQGREEGFWYVVNRLKDAGLEVTVNQQPDGSYNVRFALPAKGLEFNAKLELHMLVKQYRDGIIISETYHALTLTDLGKDWIEDQLGDSPSTDPAKWIGCSNSSDSVDTGWSVLPSEITTDGLSRAAGTYVSTGTGAWNVTNSFSVSGANSTKLYGIYHASTGDYLVAAEQQGVGNQKNVQAGDTLEITVQGSVT